MNHYLTAARAQTRTAEPGSAAAIRRTARASTVQIWDGFSVIAEADARAATARTDASRHVAF